MRSLLFLKCQYTCTEKDLFKLQIWKRLFQNIGDRVAFFLIPLLFALDLALPQILFGTKSHVANQEPAAVKQTGFKLVDEFNFLLMIQMVNRIRTNDIELSISC